MDDDSPDAEATEAPVKKGKKGHAECPDCGAFVQLVKATNTEDGTPLSFGKSEKVCLACALQRVYRAQDKRNARRAA